MTPLQLERLILEQLRQVGDRLMAEIVLWSEVRLTESRVSLSELRSSLRDLESKEQVVVVNGEVTKIKITDAGRARLME